MGVSSATLAFSGSLASSSAPEPAPRMTITATPVEREREAGDLPAREALLRATSTAAIAGEKVTISEAIGGER